MRRVFWRLGLWLWNAVSSLRATVARRRVHLGGLARKWLGSVVWRSSFSLILAHYPGMCRSEEFKYDVYDTLISYWLLSPRVSFNSAWMYRCRCFDSPCWWRDKRRPLTCWTPFLFTLDLALLRVSSRHVYTCLVTGIDLAGH
jgi:hypothetical protein